MVNRPRSKGTSAESMVVGFLQENGWPYAERRALAGGADKGDITGCPGLVWEVKAAGKTMKMGEWMGETVEEKSNASADHGILVIKPRGHGVKKVARFLAVINGTEITALNNKFPGSFGVICDQPRTYRQQLLMEDLVRFSSGFAETDVRFVVRKPPGSDEDPDKWYYATSLLQMTVLLRTCGYGNPL